MYARIRIFAQRFNGLLTGVIGILTTLLLAGAACMLALDMVSFSSIDGPAAGAVIGRTMFALALIVGLVLVAPLIGALGLFFLIKRYSQQMGPLFHIEQQVTPAVVVGPYAARQVGSADASLESLADAVERKRQIDALTGPRASEPTTFDFGPSIADELQAKRGQANRQDEAVLAQLFAENLSLYAKIELDKITEKEQEAATETNHSIEWQHADHSPTSGELEVVW